MNRLYYGDNLTIMQRMAAKSVDLIYLDPPFNSKQNYNLMYRTLTGKPVPEQAEAFCDTWEMDAQKEKLAESMPLEMKDHGVDEYYIAFWRLWVTALRRTQPHLLAYLIYMVQRLLHMKKILKPSGSIYLHCDPTASHYIKVMMDGIFGHKNFRNEIIWQRTNAHNMPAKGWARVNDTILFYSVSDKFTFNRQFEPYGAEQLKRYKTDEDGRPYKAENLTFSTANPSRQFSFRGTTPPANRSWGASLEQLEKWYDEGRILLKRDGKPRMDGLKVYLEDMKGKPISTNWTDVERVPNTSARRTGYPTQKPVPLLRRIIEASSNKGDVVFDPFCGCGTTIYAAHEAQRAWVGCDIAILAIKLIRETLLEDYRLTEGLNYEVDGIPVSVEQAEELFKHDPFQFQHWAVERVGGFPMQRKVADRGVDGRMYFETKAGLKDMVLSVKGGGVKPADVRDLRGVLERESEAELAGFISLREPTKAMKTEAAEAGVFEYGGVAYPRIQLLTVREILEGKRGFESPTKMVSRISTGQASLPMV